MSYEVKLVIHQTILRTSCNKNLVIKVILIIMMISCESSKSLLSFSYCCPSIAISWICIKILTVFIYVALNISLLSLLLVSVSKISVVILISNNLFKCLSVLQSGFWCDSTKFLVFVCKYFTLLHFILLQKFSHYFQYLFHSLTQ